MPPLEKVGFCAFFGITIMYMTAQMVISEICGLWMNYIGWTRPSGLDYNLSVASFGYLPILVAI